MGKILESYLMPHPPIAIPEIGGTEQKKCITTVEGMKSIGDRISVLMPDTIIMITPHGPVFQDAICISVNDNLCGDFEKFNHPEIRYEFRNNIELVREIYQEVNGEGIYVGEINQSFAKTYNVSYEIDHGCLVPLYYINKKYSDYKLIHIVMGMFPREELYKIGMAINKAVKRTENNVVIIASGDLSHRLIPSAPAGYNKMGKIFDKKIVEAIEKKDVEGIFDIDDNLLSQAGECGYRPLLMLMGCLDGYDYNTKILSYEGPFGVGYCNAVFDKLKRDDSKRRIDFIQEKMNKRIKELRSNEDPYVTLARLTLETYVIERKKILIPDKLPKEMIEEKLGVFVSIKKHGQLRGCIGTISSTQKNIALEIINNAINAGTKDPRFNPIEDYELDDLVYSVDILKEAENIETIEELDVIKYGVIIQSGYKRGLLLPNLEGVDTPIQQVQIALQKAGIGSNEKYTMQKFEVIRHE